MTDKDVLRTLGLANYVTIESTKRQGRQRYDYIAIGRDLRWTHIADNFGYTHWRSKVFKDAVSKLGGRLEVFTFSLGDIDASFDFHYHRDGSLIRRFVWEARYNQVGRLHGQFGSSLECEEKISRDQDPVDGLWEVASALGIERDYTKIDLKLYAPVP